MDVEARLFLRRDVEQLGIAPMSSMYWYSEIAKPTAIDWRPEVHPLDGLSIWTGTGEIIWRPLDDPERPATSTFADKSLRGFGLLQRDRNFDHYLDGVRYDRRPSLWVEPQEDWGEGAVQLVELLGGPLAKLPFGAKPQPVLSAASGTFANVFTEAVPDRVPGHWRAQFDFTGNSGSVVDIRLYLKDGSQTLSETWLYQYHVL